MLGVRNLFAAAKMNIQANEDNAESIPVHSWREIPSSASESLQLERPEILLYIELDSRIERNRSLIGSRFGVQEGGWCSLDSLGCSAAGLSLACNEAGRRSSVCDATAT